MFQIIIISSDKQENKPTSGHSNASGRKSRNLREATYHLREEALRRYRVKHSGDDPPENWEPSPTEQDDIIRALSPPGQDPDPELLAARNDGAFSNIGTPRGSVQGTPHGTPRGSVHVTPLQTPRENTRELGTPSIHVSAEPTQVSSLKGEQPVNGKTGKENTGRQMHEGRASLVSGAWSLRYSLFHFY